MALPPTIPTSFVPNSNAPRQHFRGDLTGAFGFFAYAVLAIVFLLSVAVFLYGQYLRTTKDAKDQAIVDATRGINAKTVQGFVRLRDRLTSSQNLLQNHIALSTFFSEIGKVMPATIRFSALSVTADPVNGMKLDSAGTAKNFNALAAASQAFANDGRFKNAIFSGITINVKDNSVAFTLSATLDPELTVFSP